MLEVTEEPRHIALLAQTDAITESQMMQIAGVCGEQLRTEVAPVWEMPAPRVRFYPHFSEVPAGWWPVFGRRRTDAPGAGGYHDLDERSIPYASVFIDDMLDQGSKMFRGPFSISQLFSHECIEAFLNAFLNAWRTGPDGAEWAQEGCDAVQSRSYPCTELGVEVSSFVYPAYFKADAEGPYDRLGELTKPFSILPGGYAIRKVGGKIDNIYGAQMPMWLRDMKSHEKTRGQQIARAA